VEIAPSREIPVPASSNGAEAATQEVGKPNGTGAWFTTTSSPWDAEVRKADHLASTWDVPAAAAPEATPHDEMAGEVGVENTTSVENVASAESGETVVSDRVAPDDFVSEAPSEEPVFYRPDPGLVGNEKIENHTLPELITDAAIPAETVETIRQETSYALESVAPEIVKAAEVKAPAATSQADMDALVANVLAKMSPEMLQAVTREILKPVVEAMVRNELEAKKS
jgi:hypothetical protein